VLDRLPTLWRALALFGTFSIVEDPIAPYPDSIQGFGASVFVADQFVDEFLAAGRNYLDAALYEAVMDGPSPVLSEAQVAEANSGEGLSLVVLNYGLRDHDVSNPSTQRVLQLATAAFYGLHAGYKIKTILNEVFNDAAAQYMKAGGFHLQETAGTSAAAGGNGAQPLLFALRREWVKRGVELGAGEVLITAVDHEGTRRGFDLELIRKVSESVPVPVIASGGMGTLEHFLQAARDGRADAVAMADVLHYSRLSLGEIRQAAQAGGLPVRRFQA